MINDHPGAHFTKLNEEIEKVELALQKRFTVSAEIEVSVFEGSLSVLMFRRGIFYFDGQALVSCSAPVRLQAVTYFKSLLPLLVAAQAEQEAETAKAREQCVEFIRLIETQK